MKKLTVLVFIINLILSASIIEGKEKRKIKADDLYNFKQISNIQFSPDGRWIAYAVTVAERESNSYDSDIWMRPSKGGTPIRLSRHEKMNSSPCWSPDGKYLAFLSARKGKTQIWLFNTVGGEPYQLTDMSNGISSFVWSPDSSQVAFITKDPNTKEEKKSDVIVLNRLQHKLDGVGYLDNKRHHIWIIPARGGVPRKLTDGQYDEQSISFSPDGKEILFVSNRTEDPDANHNTDIWAIDVKIGRIRQITDDNKTESNPSWSHDGEYIAYLMFEGNLEGNKKKSSVSNITFLWTVPARGGKPVNLTVDLDRNVVGRPLWSPDDKYLYFILEDSGNWHLCRIPSSGGKVERIIAGERSVSNSWQQGGVAISPEGKYLAFTLEDSLSLPELYITETSGEGLKQLTFINKELLSEVRLSKPENIHYKSFDGLEIEGWVMNPPDFHPGKKYPLVLMVHGGPLAQYGTVFSHQFQLLATEGYVVLYTNPRGSTGYGNSFTLGVTANWGNEDLKDVMAGVDYVIEQGYVDPERVGIGGYSYGGWMTNYAITRTDRFKAAVSMASSADYFSCYGTDDSFKWWEAEIGLPWDESEIYRKHSPIFDAKKVKTPTLFMCGQNDYRCPLPQSEQMYLSLKRLGIETELVIYPGESHGGSWRPDHKIDMLQRILNWFNKYLQPKEKAREK